VNKSGQTWYWADHDGALHQSSAAELCDVLAEGRLPPFVLVWQPGFMEWMPAYLLEELQPALGMEPGTVGHVEIHESASEPPEPPVEWYMECLGSPPSRSLLMAPPSTKRGRTLELDWSEGFNVHESPTLRGPQRVLPFAAFRQVDDYLAHIRALRSR
jgi:hypothetical protein